MAGSRAHQLGTIFSRVQGLLASGAMKEVDKPLWYNIYAAFPPRRPPQLQQEALDQEPVNILYKEDFIRAKFYQTYGSPGVIDMRTESIPSLCQRFVDKYNELAEDPSAEPENIFKATADALKADGFGLRSLAEIKEEQEALRVTLKQKQETEDKIILSPTEVFGKSAETSTEGGDYLDESIIDPKDPR